MRLIDADALMPNAEYKGAYDLVSAYDIVNAPTIDPVKHGLWLLEEYPDGYYHAICSECDVWFDEDAYKDRWHYCPNCGACMNGANK